MCMKIAIDCKQFYSLIRAWEVCGETKAVCCHLPFSVSIFRSFPIALQKGIFQRSSSPFIPERETLVMEPQNLKKPSLFYLYLYFNLIFG